MKDEGAGQAGGALARMRATRRRVALLAGPEPPGAKKVPPVALALLTGLPPVLTTAPGAAVAPPLMLAIPVVLGGLLPERPAMRALLLLVTVAFVVEVGDLGWSAARPGSLVGLVVIAGIAHELVRDRERLGLSVGRGESMLLELRDQLKHQGELPSLPGGWRTDIAQRSAGGSSFGGDFMVSTLTDR